MTLYGGFSATETTLAERDWSANETVLSGDLGVAGDEADNAFTVVYCGEGVEGGVDGVLITGGKANGDFDFAHLERGCGGGVYNEGVLIVVNSEISGNLAANRNGYGGGGGICNYKGTARIEIPRSSGIWRRMVAESQTAMEH